MTRSEDQIDVLDLDLERAEHAATRVLSTPEESLEFDPTSLRPSRVPFGYTGVQGPPPAEALLPLADQDDWNVSAVSSALGPDDFGSHELNLDELNLDELNLDELNLDKSVEPLLKLERPAPPPSEHGSLELEPSIAAPHAPASPAPLCAIPAELPVIPELEVSARPAPGGYPSSSHPPSGRADAQAGGVSSAPARISAAPARISAAPARISAAPARGNAPSPRSGGSPPRSGHHSSYPLSPSADPSGDSSHSLPQTTWNLGLPSFDDGGLDELDFGGAPAAKFEVAVPVVQADEVGWPVGRTPFNDQIAIDLARVGQVAGFGPVPGSLLKAPVYSYRVFAGLRALKIKESAARKALADAERARDEQLAQLAERMRSALSENDRFRSLYQDATARKASIIEQEKLQRSVDQQGAFELRNLQARLERLGEEELAKQQAADDQRKRAAQVEHERERLRAHLKRLDIEERNLEEREERTADPAELEAEFRRLEIQRQKLIERLGVVEKARIDARQGLRQTEDDLSRTTAERQACEAQREGHKVTLESELHEHSRGFDQAVHSHREALAEIGRAILELRGEIPVDEVTRKKLLASDDGVRYAATQLKVTHLASTAMDEENYRKGKWLTVLLLAMVTLLLVFALA